MPNLVIVTLSYVLINVLFFIIFYNLRAFGVKFLILVILINYSTAKNLRLDSDNVVEENYNRRSGYKTVSFQSTGDYSKLIRIAVQNQRLEKDAVYSLITESSKYAKNLEDLSIGRNKVSGEFDLGKLQPLKNLKLFWIHGNDITKFVSSATEDMPAMEHMDLEQNKLSSIDFEIFERFPNMGQLFLSGNKLVEIDLGKYQVMKKTIRIILGNNKIAKITNTATENMPLVFEIILSDNQLTSVDLNDFAKFVNLKKLLLDGNKLTSIEGFPMAKTTFPNIDYIAINRNEFKCDYLKEITKPYVWASFWFEVEDMEESCPGPKSVYYKEKTCCYP